MILDHIMRMGNPEQFKPEEQENKPEEKSPEVHTIGDRVMTEEEYENEKKRREEDDNWWRESE